MGRSPFPLPSISSPFYQSLISQTLTPDSSAHLVASLHLKPWKASAPIEGEEDCEVLTTMGLIHQACVCTNLCYFTSRCMPSMPPNFLICFANVLFHNCSSLFTYFLCSN